MKEFLKRNWKWGIVIVLAIVAFIAIVHPFGWLRPAPQIVEVEKQVVVKEEVVKTVQVEKVVEKVVMATPGLPTTTPTTRQTPTLVKPTATSQPGAAVVTPTATSIPPSRRAAVPSPTPDQRIEQLVQDVRDLAVAVAGMTEIVSQTISSQASVVQASSRVSQTTAVSTTVACPPAEQLGPWAPGADGTGETFEVSAARGWIHVSLWWPNGQTPWGTKEVSVLLSPGTSIEVVAGAGTAWDYAASCSKEEVVTQRDAYAKERPKWTSFHGVVALDELIRLGLVRKR